MVNADVIALFKAGKIQDFLMLKEINNNIKAPMTVAVEFGKLPNGANNKSFIASFLPVTTGARIVSKMIVYFDRNVLLNLPNEKIMQLVEYVAKYSVNAQREYLDFILSKNGVEIPRSEYLKALVQLNHNFLLKLLTADSSYGSFVNTESFNKVLDAFANDDLISDVIEDIKQANVLPADTLAYVRKFLANADADSPEALSMMDKYFNKLISLTTSKENPYWSKEIPESVIGSDY